MRSHVSPLRPGILLCISLVVALFVGACSDASRTSISAPGGLRRDGAELERVTVTAGACDPNDPNETETCKSSVCDARNPSSDCYQIGCDDWTGCSGTGEDPYDGGGYDYDDGGSYGGDDPCALNPSACKGDTGGGTGGSGDTTSSAPTTQCDPALPGCLDPLKPHDKAVLDSALARVDRDNPNCALFADSVSAAIQDGNMYRGDSTVAERPGEPDHFMATWRETTHIDEEWLERYYNPQFVGDANRQAVFQKVLAGAALHESMHRLGMSHDDTDKDSQGRFVTFPWVLTQITNAQTGASACVP